MVLFFENLLKNSKFKGTKDQIEPLLKSGIYEVGCQPGCDFKYLGMTQRNPTIRFGEHEYSISKNDPKNGVAGHVNKFNHSTDMSNVRLVEQVFSRDKRVFQCATKGSHNKIQPRCEFDESKYGLCNIEACINIW